MSVKYVNAFRAAFDPPFERFIMRKRHLTILTDSADASLLGTQDQQYFRRFYHERVKEMRHGIGSSLFD
jgi:hypothetical protein